MTEVAERKRGGAAQRPGPETAKRAADFVISLIAIISLTPLWLLLWLLVRSTSSGPALFRQQRLGRDKHPFTLLKLRTLYIDHDDRIHRDYVTGMLTAGTADRAAAGPSGTGRATGTAKASGASGASGLFKLEADPRVTRLGGWLRRSSLDELPQLINVLKGEMSLVGPRPVLSWEADLFGEPYQRRFAVKPGMTGLWQVSGRNRLSMREALELDVEYVTRWSFMFDLVILFRTVPALFGGGAR
jgi:lipopolysaccharide/colanic/teichoic acid biosynthesis glycosyltransferase